MIFNTASNCFYNINCVKKGKEIENRILGLLAIVGGIYALSRGGLAIIGGIIILFTGLVMLVTGTYPRRK